MAIQFPCPGCQQPIEVDDEHAGRTAACPYCRQVVTVPQESTYRPDMVAQARPTACETTPESTPVWSPPAAGVEPAQFPPPPEGAYPRHTPVPRERAARRYGTYALLCGVLTLTLFGVIGVAIILRAAQKLATYPPTHRVTRDEANQAVMDATRELAKEPWHLAATAANAMLALVGLALAITSVSQRALGNWRGIVALIICGAYVLCVCGGTLAAIVSGLAGRS